VRLPGRSRAPLRGAGDAHGARAERRRAAGDPAPHRSLRPAQLSVRSARRSVPPWLLDVRTGAWGAAPIEVTAEAQKAGVPLARGSGTPTGDTIAVTLADIDMTLDGSVDDLAPPPPDLSSFADLTALPDLVTLPDLLSCPVTTMFQATLLADTGIYGSSPTLNFGADAVATVSTGFPSVGLYRFDVHLLPAGANIRSVKLTLSYAKNSTACAAACGSCASIEKAGLLTLFYLRSDWVEAQCSWNMASTTTSWGSPGASAADVDRSAASVGMVSHAVTADVVFNVDPALLGIWRASDQLSFTVVPSNGAAFVFATKEWDNCAVTGTIPVAPKLEISYCP
jgi:hypothetical protein